MHDDLDYFNYFNRRQKELSQQARKIQYNIQLKGSDPFGVFFCASFCTAVNQTAHARPAPLPAGTALQASTPTGTACADPAGKI